MEMTLIPNPNPAPAHSYPRIFVRCKLCLQPAALEDRFPSSAKCGVCDGDIEYMGRVQLSRLVKDEERCACDDRCVCATGPNCNCACGGKNHGSNMLVTVVRDAGPIPRINPLDPAKSREIADAYLRELENVTEKLQAAFPQIKRAAMGDILGSWDSTQLMRGRRMIMEIRHASSLRTQHGRMKALRAIAEDIDKKAGQAAVVAP